MNKDVLKASIALISVSVVFATTTVIWLTRKSASSLSWLLGTVCLVAVVLTHLFEALRLFPRMHWGSENSVGHYLDLLCAILGVTLLSIGYLIHLVRDRPRKNKERV
jgi:hypothetical protein